MHDYPNHDWRADDFTLIRGRWHGSVSRGWCVDGDVPNVWRWLVWRIDDTGSIEDTKLPDRSNGTFAEAIAGAEAFIAARFAEEKLGNVFAFEGAPAPDEHQEEGGDPWEREKAAAAAAAEMEPF